MTAKKGNRIMRLSFSELAEIENALVIVRGLAIAEGEKVSQLPSPLLTKIGAEKGRQYVKGNL